MTSLERYQRVQRILGLSRIAWRRWVASNRTVNGRLVCTRPHFEQRIIRLHAAARQLLGNESFRYFPR